MPTTPGGCSLCSDCDLPFAAHPGYENEDTIITDLMCLQALRNRVAELEAERDTEAACHQ